jgi:hypothetical protein
MSAVRRLQSLSSTFIGIRAPRIKAMSTLSNDQHTSTQLQGFYGWTDSLKGVYYGPGCLQTALPKLRAAIGGKKALIVTGKSLYNKVLHPNCPFFLLLPHT